MLTSMPEERREKVANLPVFLRRFSAFWVLTRCVSHGAGVLERQKKYAVAISWQRFLLKNSGTMKKLKCFCTGQRGALWDRLSLNLDAHLKEREEALQEIREGMEDDAVADKDKLMLQDRALRISNRDFLERIVLTEPIKKEIYGRTLSKDLGDSRINRFVLKDVDNHVVECSVEEVVRKHYLDKEGFNNVRFFKRSHFRYVDAKELEIELLGFLGNNKFTEAYECAFKAREMLTSMPEERREKVANLPVFLRRFSAFWVLTRCVSHGAGVLERQKKYAVAISWQRFLLKTPGRCNIL
ncbi:hypothetical protein COOONC_13032 [Cooperia oncophora]